MDIEFNQNDIKILAKSIKSRVLEFNRNETILSDIRDEGAIAFVQEGLVYLCAENEDYERSILRFFRKGDMLSVGLQPDEERCVSYFTAKSPSKIIFFRRDELLALFGGGAAWREKLSGLFIHQLEKTATHTNLMLHQRTIRSRLTAFFNDEVKYQGTKTIKLPLPYSDLADYLVIERSALMREIKKMKDEGLISGRNKTITVN